MGSAPGLLISGWQPISIGTSMAGIRKTGLLAANAFRTFLAFIFKNALAANNGKRGGVPNFDCRLPIRSKSVETICYAAQNQGREL